MSILSVDERTHIKLIIQSRNHIHLFNMIHTSASIMISNKCFVITNVHIADVGQFGHSENVL